MAPSSSLAECRLTFAESKMTHDDFKGKKISDMKFSIAASGGSYTTKVSECTHLVATPEQYKANNAKVQDAKQKSDVHLVNFEWLSAALTSTSKVDETLHLLRDDAADIIESTLNDKDLPVVPNDKKRSRAVSSDDIQETDSKKAKKSEDDQKAKSASVRIPIDDECTIRQNAKVYIDENGTIFDVTLNQTNAGQNNNKFYRIQLLENDDGHFTWTRWGRVGEKGQKLVLGDGAFESAVKEFEKKFKDKTGHKWADRQLPPKAALYTFIERNYEDSSNEENDDLPGGSKRRTSQDSIESTSSTPESKLPGAVQRLMQLIFNQQYFHETMASYDYDSNKMPLGKLSKRTLLQGYEVLKDLATLVSDPTAGSKIEEHSNRYFSLIPHSFGRHRPPILSNQAMIKREIGLLESLTDMQLANDIMKAAKSAQEVEKLNIADRQYQGLGMQEMTPLDMGGKEFTEIKEYLIKSAGGTHGMSYKVQDIFRIERSGENDRYGHSAYAKIQNSDRRLLWHGSRCTNFGGILSQGLRIAPPEAPVSGYMFGKGIYLADMSTKSANYCASYTSGNIGLLLLCEAELGKPPLKLTGSDYEAGEKARAVGCISTWGVGSTAPKGWKDAGCLNPGLEGVLMPDVSVLPGPALEANSYLLYNEYIVYDVAQIRLRYLLRVEIR